MGAGTSATNSNHGKKSKHRENRCIDSVCWSAGPGIRREPFRGAAQAGRDGDRDSVHRNPQSSSFRPLDVALKNLNHYDWLILTSVNGVEAMWERMGKLRPQACSSVCCVAAIGPATKKAIEQRGTGCRRCAEGIRGRIRGTQLAPTREREAGSAGARQELRAM